MRDECVCIDGIVLIFFYFIRLIDKWDSINSGVQLRNENFLVYFCHSKG